MKLTIISHKETWLDSSSPSGFSTIGGFPFQMKAISEIFDKTVIVVPIRKSPLPSGARHLTGHNLQVLPLTEPKRQDFRRKLQMIIWLPRNLPIVWREVRRADAVHTPVPGDIGSIGILLALVLRKPLLVRHCGIWGKPITITDKILFWLLEHIAGGKIVVLATGGSDLPPSERNPNIDWIFSTTLTSAELEQIPRSRPWSIGQPLNLITVCRISQSKNIHEIIRAIPEISQVSPQVQLHVLGDGEYLPYLKALVSDLSLEEHVIFHGNVSHDQVLKSLSEAHLFVFPTQREGFPKAILEALACGLPIVASNVSVIPYLIQGCGIMLQDTTSDHIARAVVNLINEPDRLAEMAAAAVDRSKQFTLESWRDEISKRLQVAWGPLQQATK